jgi:phenylacetate-CoA ligase
VSIAKALYRRLPISVRSVAATAQGLRLSWWRYGRVAETAAMEAQERDYWSRAQWAAWREERLAYVLHRAATRVPYYREQWAARRRRGDKSSWEVLANWPILEKEEVRRAPRAFVADDCSVRRMFHLRTSGTTGMPLDIWRTRETVQALYGIGTTRTRGWHGVTLRDRRAMLGGQIVTPVEQQRPPFWVWNAALHQLYMSIQHLAPDLIPYYLDALARYRIRYIAGYPSSIHTLAEEALRLGRDDLRMVVVLANSEPLLPHQRETIERAFQCPARETYGMTETVASATECEAGRLHQWPEEGLIEVLDGRCPVPPGSPGEFVCTGLLNADQPLIRYRVGDCGRVRPADELCSCGRSLPLMASIDGRTDDILYTPDGRRVYRMNPVLYGLPLREAQFVQEAVNRMRVRVVPAAGFGTASEQALAARIRERMGDVGVLVEEVSAIPRTATGKFRLVICQMPAAEREAVLAGRERAARRPA